VVVIVKATFFPSGEITRLPTCLSERYCSKLIEAFCCAWLTDKLITRKEINNNEILFIAADLIGYISNLLNYLK
jgi:hypothetical protein